MPDVRLLEGATMPMTHEEMDAWERRLARRARNQDLREAELDTNAWLREQTNHGRRPSEADAIGQAHKEMSAYTTPIPAEAVDVNVVLVVYPHARRSTPQVRLTWRSAVDRLADLVQCP